MATRDALEKRLHQNAKVIWLFGLSGSGKSTLATHLAGQLRIRGIPVLALDGDAVRSGLCQGLGFSDADRAENLRRSAELAVLALKSGLSVVASFITPLESHRQLVTGIIGTDRLSLVLLDAPLDTCRARDVKGLYAGATAGKVAQMTGLTSRFEKPTSIALAIDTATQSAEASATQLLEYTLLQLAAQ